MSLLCCYFLVLSFPHLCEWADYAAQVKGIVYFISVPRLISSFV